MTGRIKVGVASLAIAGAILSGASLAHAAGSKDEPSPSTNSTARTNNTDRAKDCPNR